MAKNDDAARRAEIARKQAETAAANKRARDAELLRLAREQLAKQQEANRRAAEAAKRDAERLAKAQAEAARKKNK
jgi:hypothetical protein